MSYCRRPSMIYPTKTGIMFNFHEIPNDDVDIFLYKIFSTRQKELAERLKHGKELLEQYDLPKNGLKDVEVDIE